MERNTLGEVMGLSMTKMKEMVDVNTVIGNPIFTPDGITLIPVTQVSMGIATGGADVAGKANTLGAGAGSGVKMNPQGFLIIKDGMIRFVSISSTSPDSLPKWKAPSAHSFPDGTGRRKDSPIPPTHLR